MIRNPFIAALAGILLLAGAGPAAAQGMECRVIDTPAISVTPRTDEIQYDYSTASADLGAMKAGVSGQAANADRATGGLRVDTPVTEISVLMSTMEHTGLKQGCIWYKKVDVTINLHPHIYIAKEFNVPGPCRDAIMAHEIHHVDVDREMMNKYATIIGEAVRTTVNGTGALGPFPSGEMEKYKKDLSDRAQKALLDVEIPLRAEMNERQAQVDSPAEYSRVSAICNHH